MLKNNIICDACKKENLEGEDINIRSLPLRSKERGKIERVNYDFCLDCLEKLDSFLDTFLNRKIEE